MVPNGSEVHKLWRILEKPNKKAGKKAKTEKIETEKHQFKWKSTFPSIADCGLPNSTHSSKSFVCDNLPDLCKKYFITVHGRRISIWCDNYNKLVYRLCNICIADRFFDGTLDNTNIGLKLDWTWHVFSLLVNNILLSCWILFELSPSQVSNLFISALHNQQKLGIERDWFDSMTMRLFDTTVYLHNDIYWTSQITNRVMIWLYLQQIVI